MIDVAVIGTGTLGKRVVKILEEKHPYANVVCKENSKRKEGKLSKAKQIFLCLPPNKARPYMRKNRIGNKRIIDLSPDHRCDEDWDYGLPELNKDSIRDSKRVANPGCYAITNLKALIHINGFITDIKIEAYSGVSGRSGLKVDKTRGIKEYSIGEEHYQIAEIEKHSGKKIESFRPYLVHALDTGIVARIHAKLDRIPGFSHLFEHTLEDNFEEIVDFRPHEKITIEYLEEMLKDVKHTNQFKLYYYLNGNSITLISTLDNVMKGGAGQAIQNFNIMYGFPEMLGLP